MRTRRWAILVTSSLGGALVVAGLLAGQPLRTSLAQNSEPCDYRKPSLAALSAGGATERADFAGNRLEAHFYDVEEVQAPTKLFPINLPLSLPRDLEVAADGAIWFTDRGAGQIGRLDPTTENFSFYLLPEPSIKSVWFDRQPSTLAFNPTNGDIWAGNARGYQVWQLPAGAAPGSSATEHSFSAGDTLCVDSVDAVHVDGAGVVRIAETETDPDKGYTARYELDEGDASYLVGRQNTLSEFNQTGIHFTECSRSESILIDPAGNVWLACELSQAIAVKTTTGQFRIYPVSGNPQQLAIDAAGNIWFSETTGAASQYIGRLNPRRARPGVDPSLNRGLTEIALSFIIKSDPRPKGLRIDSSGNLWFAHYKEIWRYDPVADSFQFYPVPREIVQQQAQGQELALDATGNIWYAGGVPTYNDKGQAMAENPHLGLVQGVAPNLSTAPGGVINGQLVGGTTQSGPQGQLTLAPNTQVRVPARGLGGFVARAEAGQPFTGAIHPPVPYEGSDRPAFPNGRSLVPDSLVNVAAMTLSGDPVVVDLDQPATLTFSVTLPAGVNPSEAQVWRLDPATGTWLAAGVGATGGQVTATTASVQTTQTGLFAVTLGIAPTPTYSPTPVGIPARNVFLPLIARDQQVREISDEISLRGGW